MSANFIPFSLCVSLFMWSHHIPLRGEPTPNLVLEIAA